MNEFAALIYWLIVGLWIAVLAVVATAFARGKKQKQFSAMRLLLFVVTIDTSRNIIENIYFGLYFGARYGLFPAGIIEVLGNPALLIVPKIANVAAACVVFSLLLFRWLPRISKERSDIQHDLHQAEWKFQLLVDGVQEYAIYLLDPAGNVTSWNSGAERIKGYKASEIIGQHFSTFYTNEDRAAGRPQQALQIAAKEGRFETRASRMRKDGTTFWANVVIDAIRDDTGNLIGFAKVTKDITEERQAEERLVQLAHFDQLTGLPNRSSLMHDLAACSNDPPLLAAVSMLDLDGFKAINDTLGHAVGDHVLQEVADRGREVVGSSGQFYRLGGDEFVIVLPKCQDPLYATDIINEMLRRFAEAIDNSGKPVFITASCGLTFVPSEGATAEDLLAQADLALYEAKEAGGNRCHLFVPTMRAQAHARQELGSELRRAVKDQEFVLHYQPQIRLGDGKVVGAEALLRWRHPQRGLLAPGVFIDALSESPFAREVGNWVLQDACATAARWREDGLGSLRIGVNLFPAQFHADGLVSDVETAIKMHDLAAEALELEITENIAFGQDEKILNTLRALRGLGVGLAFDDFGTGYASLSYLTKYPLTRVKIDRSFVQNIAKRCPQQATAVVRSMIVMAHNLGFDVIAEGVETPDQASFLQAKRCDEVQGYLYAKPLPADEFERFLRGYDSRRKSNMAAAS
jgi:diguanylate cyclase (GGDEF)-like protein/PAS domain S-box-containing protein